MEDRKDAAMDATVEVDQNVAAANQIEAGEGRVSGDIVAGKDAVLAKLFSDLVLAIGLGEKSGEAVRREVVFNSLRIDTLAGALEREFADVSAEQLDGAPQVVLMEEFMDPDGVGVDLFPGSATRYPDPDRLI